MTWDDLVARFLDGLTLGLQGVGVISLMFANWGSRLDAEGGSWGGTLLLIAVVVAVALAVGLAARRIVTALVARSLVGRADVLSRAAWAARLALADAAGIAAFVLAGHATLRLVSTPGTLTHHTIFAVTLAVLVGLVYAAIGRFLLAPRQPEVRLIAIEHPGWHWWMLLAYGALGGIFAQVVRLASAIGLEPLALEGWFLAGTSLLTVIKVVWFVAGGRDIRRAFAGETPGFARNVVAALLPAFYMVTAVGLWVLACMVTGKGQSAAVSAAGGASQILLLLLPIAGLGVYALASAQIDRIAARTELAPLERALARGGQTLAAGGVWLLGMHLIFLTWHPLLVDGLAPELAGFITGALRVVLTFVICWAAWSALETYFAAFAPASRPAVPGAEEEGAQTVGTGRLSTILPLVRNVVFIAILVVATLVVLSSLGLDIGPLLAGFGIFGLALSFGSQTLVRDIVSGIFFIADDAFRHGEYVDTGRLKGTVERISLRSIQLRHQNGPLHTIPFGQLQAITNYSRDWSTVKFELNFERDTDPEVIRKVVKKVGLAMLEDEEVGKEFLVPLKMQGIQNITENSLVVRLKFTARPGNPSLIQRQAMRRLLIAFKENGLVLASNAVTVRGDAGGAMSGAAAAEVVRQVAAEKAAAAGAEA